MVDENYEWGDPGMGRLIALKDLSDYDLVDLYGYLRNYLHIYRFQGGDREIVYRRHEIRTVLKRLYRERGLGEMPPPRPPPSKRVESGGALEEQYFEAHPIEEQDD